jgi:hypothetical protein
MCSLPKRQITGDSPQCRQPRRQNHTYSRQKIQKQAGIANLVERQRRVPTVNASVNSPGPYSKPPVERRSSPGTSRKQAGREKVKNRKGQGHIQSSSPGDRQQAQAWHSNVLPLQVSVIQAEWHCYTIKFENLRKTNNKSSTCKTTEEEAQSIKSPTGHQQDRPPSLQPLRDRIEVLPVK